MLLDGKKIAKKIQSQLKEGVHKNNLRPGLAIILIGENPNSKTYIRLKEKASQRLNFYFQKIFFPTNCQKSEILSTIENLNSDPNLHGLMIQMPVPSQFDPDFLINKINPQKDVDGFLQKSKFTPPTHQAILTLIKESKRELKGKQAIILSKNPIFALPLKKILEQESIIAVHERTIPNRISSFDLVISALGEPKIIQPLMLKKNAIVIDVGYSKIKGKAWGDVDPRCQKRGDLFISPVPGGVGPLTVAYLLKNVYISALDQK
ncbi:bifunctional 5,10-methylenetetrahydrofolate dehydrogenase/5,10-methenyltetrahydrofolate cyclohydrolase [Patescibacteria group bacterium]|nr:bifunctional 5,10-methylenetetrahydrofolate dehydrogenase/5,10-methenyltetrahydrofolate cyclohydrolase [Patescibacteria group bacterium]